MQGPPGTVDTITLKRPQNKFFIFRPCYIEPPGLPPDFYELNDINCPAESGYVADDGLFDFENAPPYPYIYEGANETAETLEGNGTDVGADPLCLWSITYQWETNPPSLYIGYDDPCWIHYPPSGAVNNQYVDLYYYAPGEWPQPEGQSMFGRRRSEEDDYELGEPVTVRVAMDKGKRLNPLLMPDNVASQGTAGTASTLVSIGLGMAFGDPKPMVRPGIHSTSHFCRLTVIQPVVFCADEKFTGDSSWRADQRATQRQYATLCESVFMDQHGIS
eukprot:COSAG02_NODE_1217_length_13824_cov_14.009180_2_plen_275_part_00